MRARVVEAMARAAAQAGNPSSIHGPGRRARRLMADCGAQVLAAARLPGHRVVFAASGDEAVHLALAGLVAGAARAGGEVWVQGRRRFDEQARLAADAGARVVRRMPKRPPAVALLACPRAVAWAAAAGEAPTTRLVVVCGRRCELDCLAGLDEWLAAAVIPAAPLGGPAGVTALLAAPSAPLHSAWGGGDQQHGLRPGTPPVVLAVGLAAALA